MTATEDRLRAALDAWADGVATSPDPWAEHRRRVRRDRHRRITAPLAAAAAALVVAGLAAGLPSTRSDGVPAHPRPVPSLSPPDFSDFTEYRPTSEVVPVGSLANIGHFFVYWSHDRLCYVLASPSGHQVSGSGCSPVGRSAAALRPIATGDANLALAVVAARVTSAAYTATNGDVLPARIVRGDGFPAPVAAVLDRRVWQGRWHAYDAAGQPLPTAQPFELDVRQVIAEWPARQGTCTGRHPYVDGQIVGSTDGLTCYALAWDKIRVRRTVSATALQNSQTGSWLVQVELPPADGQRFADLTGRVYRAPEPRDELALVLDGTVFEAPSIQSRIAGGLLQLAAPSMTERQARELAAELAGG